jgi:hypothetical protein
MKSDFFADIPGASFRSPEVPASQPPGRRDVFDLEVRHVWLGEWSLPGMNKISEIFV